MSDDLIRQEFQELANAWIDGRATEEQSRRLEEMASSSAELMRLFVDLSLLNASLMQVADVSPPSPLSPTLAKQPAASPELKCTESKAITWFSFSSVAIASAVTILMTLTWGGLFWNATADKETFASLDAIAGTRWISASVPTDSGSQIGCGSLKLAAGLVTIKFDVGAVVDLEGPADFQILSPTRCRLNSGKLLATVRNSFKGFVVETPNAILTDQGTSFCVSVQQDGDSNMQVLEGRVDVEDRTTGFEKQVFGNSSVRFSQGRILDSFDVEQGMIEETVAAPNETKVIHLSTSVGDGFDYWIQRNDLKPGSESQFALPILLVKWSIDDYRRYDRKAYLRFDLSEIPSSNLTNASLSVNAIPSGLGFAAITIDSTFAVYGVTDDELDRQLPDSTWDDAPSSSDSGGSVDPSTTRLLGKFVIPQGVQEGTFSVQSEELADFLVNDRNRFATLIVVCETQSVASSSIVFGFAGRNNNKHSPPTLRLEYQK